MPTSTPVAAIALAEEKAVAKEDEKLEEETVISLVRYRAVSEGAEGVQQWILCYLSALQPELIMMNNVIGVCLYSNEDIRKLYLKVKNDNESAIKFYEKFGVKTSNMFKRMALVPEAQTIGISDSH
ncbi:hypothetical protein K1719_016321 [Acacia pycnantha]|nr:hypothetical protein K1719_016321 [Acacia pycnantha]